ncbi:hypothetical protein APHNP_0209 [Anaplasma phagocytophilum str. ApNP]|uniref:Uncharacterized protein n=2 Tax=Anaplasma phagocytophilum TaxID=948 RepID=A0A0F3NHX6_ANAPH|nr:hypothetical protein [Anaplasma phagocytophilum]KJV63999.1 hypothetical protein APHMUC_0439 [Anaplasma phagocytophilum str. ApMUC09]KJV67391.1 hypothetical protein APHNP_0209 [Anaplasma phagocytophilum str. ApNP]
MLWRIITSDKENPSRIDITESTALLLQILQAVAFVLSVAGYTIHGLAACG